MRYQILITGFGGQGAVFLVKLLSIASSLKGYNCIGTENHGMSQRGGSVSCGIKIGDFYSPNIDENSADLIIALEKDEALRYIHFLNQKDGVLVVNSDDKFDKIKQKHIKFDAFAKAKNGDFDIGGLNVYMLGVAMKNVENFPFSFDEIARSLEIFNPKVSSKNTQILRLAMEEK
ncbi:2-oxoacid:acceptor oxidoreductase family protein [Campylobacter geochelonis]|uniref:Indolepyruvate oxidoreductase subunit beta n=1 Tax=Campylobacter geochelonis TaxID=1780362 RepID=A0A128EIP7_9BACT|nr:2-oxoacid:acceptor oxidoreductase family protein [Campylobacter geochelonis]QKF71156.1 indolepyruvate ferredoxin oxidoreductase, beta subunit [Campylobacter geochelonis]CZE48242.1 indolepyruvate oxidoreductase subunit beta [Campylobacter geochelonis]CZE48548.1 indolepyruvate oxidoreductase subunit beta [Campylobacter geochelonis]CZE50035.1 indolepyruvate oxidoreductase subunit beta [Campylobacter geochelonis]